VSAPVRLTCAADAVGDIARALRPPETAADPQIGRFVAETIAAVRADGDGALVVHGREFGSPGFVADDIRVPAAALAAARAALDPGLAEAIQAAAAQVRAFGTAVCPSDREVVLGHGQRITQRAVPVAAAGCYVPGGRAAYPSSLVMTVVPAQVAGVARIAVASPPGPDGLPAAVILATAALLGVDEVYAVGGAAAIAALAYGTPTVTPVSVITGPGSSWVQEAKRQVTGQVGIDGFAGPSEVMVVADATADPTAIAFDLLAQVEHGPDSVAALASDDPAFVDAVGAVLAEEPDPPGAVTLVDCPDLDVAVALAEVFAPEHLEIWVGDGSVLADRIRQAGAVFIGPNCATAYGDYVAGSNHVLPTGGAARFASALGPSTYLRRMSIVEITDQAVRELTPHLVRLAEAEGFAWHARSAAVRDRNNEGAR
jgi:histidinol dehydrogenase